MNLRPTKLLVSSAILMPYCAIMQLFHGYLLCVHCGFVCFPVYGYCFVWDNTQMEIKSSHQTLKNRNRFKLWALMFAVKNRVEVTDEIGQPKLWLVFLCNKELQFQHDVDHMTYLNSFK